MTTNRKLAHVTLLVDDYDKAIAFYVGKLGFHLMEDTRLSDEKRWVVVAPNQNGGASLLLGKASNEQQRKCVGNQSGGRVFLFLYTDDFDQDYQRLIDQRIKIIRPPVEAPYGRVVVFEDLYGNHWDLIEPLKFVNS